MTIMTREIEESCRVAEHFERQCPQCGGPIDGRRNKKFCSKACARWHNKEHWQELNPKTAKAQLASGTIGSVNLMRVMLDLVGRGFHVYKSAFEAMPFELLAYKGEDADPYDRVCPLRIKVTTGQRTTGGKLSHRKFDASFDTVAVVLGNEIIYEPGL